MHMEVKQPLLSLFVFFLKLVLGYFSTKKPIVDYTFPSNEEYERNSRDSASTAHNLERKDHNKSVSIHFSV